MNGLILLNGLINLMKMIKLNRITYVLTLLVAFAFASGGYFLAKIFNELESTLLEALALVSIFYLGRMFLLLVELIAEYHFPPKTEK